MPSDLPTSDQPDNDPWLWLEEVNGVDALAWADAQTAATLRRFGGDAFERDVNTLRTMLDRPDKLPGVTRRGGLLYNFWVDAAHPRGLWRRTTIERYREPDPGWDILLDLDALATTEGEDWVWSGATTLPPDHARALLRLSRGGGDATVTREYDVEQRCFVEDGFVLPETKGGGSWLDADTLLLASALGGVTRSGYARTVRLWRRGTDPADAPVVFETDPAHMGVAAEFDRADGRVMFTARIGFFDTEASIGTVDGPQQRLDLPSDAVFAISGGWLAVQPRKPWTVAGHTHAPDTVLCARFDDYLAGGRDLRGVFTPGERQALQGFFWSDGQLVVSLLDDLRPTYLAYDPKTERSGVLPGLPTIGTVQAWPLDVEEVERDGTLLVAAQDPLTPPSLLLLTGGAAELLKRAPSYFDVAGLVTTWHEAVSTDGERIPYIQIGPPSLTGDAPVHMTAYGGFRVSLLPSYRGALGRLWLEPGGTAVVANIRGGGEFGTRWHDAGRREGKARSHDDFAAVAADLVARGVTCPGRIAAEGGSNGGLLIANMLTRYPDRFGALFCTIPLVDMRRYTRLLAGASWIAEYGDPDVPGDWAFLSGLSAYHAAKPDQTYPPILLATARRDDRVHPGHARKMAAKLQAMGYDASFYEPPAGGHGYGKDNAEIAAFMALGIGFLRWGTGWA